MEDILSSLATYGYIVLFLYSLGGGFVALAAAGVLSFAGKMDLTTSIIVATLANFIGDTILFYLGRYNKRDIYGYLKKHRRKLAFSHILIKRHGSKVIIFQKFVYGIKTLIPLAIGVTKYPFGQFTLYNAGASILWGLGVGLAGYSGGELVMRFIGYSSEHPYLPPIIILGLIGGLWWYMSQVTKKR